MSLTPKYEDFREPPKRVSLARPLMLAGLMLLGVFFLSPFLKIMRQPDQKAVRTEDVEIPEPDIPPVLPDSKPVLSDPVAVAPVLEIDSADRGITAIEVEQLDASIEAGYSDDRLVDTVGEIAALPEIAEIEAFNPDQVDQLPRWKEARILNVPPHLVGYISSGEVQLDLLIDREGKVRVVNLLSSSHRELSIPAMELAKSFPFYPAELSGNSVASWTTLEVAFSDN